jgi:hypothetical protein
MTARVVSLNVQGNLDGVTLVEEFPEASVGNTQEDRDLAIYQIDYSGDVGVFRMNTLMRAIPGYESADSFFPQVQFQPGPFALIDFLVLGPELTGAGIRVPVVNANASCIYTERRGGWRIRSSNPSGLHKIGMFMSPLTTQDQIIHAACCFCESVKGDQCDPIVITSSLIDPRVDPGPPPQISGVFTRVTLLSVPNADFLATDVWQLVRQTDGNLIFSGFATNYNGPGNIDLEFTPNTPADNGVYRLIGRRLENPNCGVSIDNFLEVV